MDTMTPPTTTTTRQLGTVVYVINSWFSAVKAVNSWFSAVKAVDSWFSAVNAVDSFKILTKLSFQILTKP